MDVNNLTPKFVPLIDNLVTEQKTNIKPSDTSLLITTPEEIKENLQRWIEHNERIHVIV
jgi:hypothetical protein